MNEPVFTGVGVALVTLFHDDGTVDAAGTGELAAELVAAGVRGVVVAGSTGEAAALDVDERVAVLRAVRKAVDASSGAAVVAGTGAPSARQAVRFTRDAADAGADAVLVLSPPSSDDVRPYYEQVVACTDIPVLAYHYPVVSAPGIPVDVLTELPVAGCKDSSGDPNRLLETLTRWTKPLYVGSAAILTLAGPLGCAGAILALANAEPELCIRAFAGDAAAQLELAAAHKRALAPFPAGIKRMTAERFGTSAVTRMG